MQRRLLHLFKKHCMVFKIRYLADSIYWKCVCDLRKNFYCTYARALLSSWKSVKGVGVRCKMKPTYHGQVLFIGGKLHQCNGQIRMQRWRLFLEMKASLSLCDRKRKEWVNYWEIEIFHTFIHTTLSGSPVFIWYSSTPFGPATARLYNYKVDILYLRVCLHGSGSGGGGGLDPR